MAAPPRPRARPPSSGGRGRAAPTISFKIPFAAPSATWRNAWSALDPEKHLERPEKRMERLDPRLDPEKRMERLDPATRMEGLEKHVEHPARNSKTPARARRPAARICSA